MVHINVAHNWNIYFEDASYACTPTSHNSLSSSTNDCKYTSIAIPGEVRPRIINDRIKDDHFLL